MAVTLANQRNGANSLNAKSDILRTLMTGKIPYSSDIAASLNGRGHLLLR